MRTFHSNSFSSEDMVQGPMQEGHQQEKTAANRKEQQLEPNSTEVSKHRIAFGEDVH